MRKKLKPKITVKEIFFLSEKETLKSIYESVQGTLCEHIRKGQLKNVVVICDPNFMHELLAYFHWCEDNAQNYYEDVFRIAGQTFYGDDGKLIFVPRFLLRMVSTERGKTSVVTSVVEKQGAEYQNYTLNQSLAHTEYGWLSDFGPLEVIGHGHSHPNLGAIGVKPSSIDVKDHKRNSEDRRLWLSQIVDPNRGLLDFYFGPDMKSPKVIYLLYPEDRPLFERRHNPFKRRAPSTVPKHIKTVKGSDEEQTQSTEERPRSTEEHPQSTEERPQSTEERPQSTGEQPQGDGNETPQEATEFSGTTELSKSTEPTEEPSAGCGEEPNRRKASFAERISYFVGYIEGFINGFIDGLVDSFKRLRK